MRAVAVRRSRRIALLLPLRTLLLDTPQPLLLGRAVRVHPLAVILGIAAGVVVGGIFGALVAVPLIAVLNAVGHHLLDPEPPGVDEPEDLITPAEQAEVEADVDESEEMARIEPGERGPYDT